MNLNIKEEYPDHDVLKAYSDISIAFEVKSKYSLELLENGLGGIVFKEVKMSPYIKDYDVHDTPHDLLKKFDISNWRVLAAYDGDKRIGGALLAFNTPGIHMLEGRIDLAVVWDIRISKSYRHKGVGRELMEASKSWARSKKCKMLKVETQNINVGACKFYVSQGGQLCKVDTNAYSDLPYEVQLIWQYIL